MPPGAEKLDFRGVWAWDAMTAIVMSSGPGDQSRLYKTTDGCVNWKLLLTNPDKDGFWDAIVFSDRNHGYLLGDPVNGHFSLRATGDGGTTWTEYGGPEAPPDAGVFAASNSSMGILFFMPENGHPNCPYFGTSGTRRGTSSLKPRVYRPTALGAWEDVEVPLSGGSPSAGIFSIASSDGQTMIAVGGDYQKPNDTAGTAAFTRDGGRHWSASTKPPHGYRSAVAWDAADKAWVTAGPNGSDFSRDDGRTWEPLDYVSWNAISLPWFVGPDGRIGKLVSLPTTGPIRPKLR
jgi:photosystem II stability/assembly factor-like uncharacterized protein